MSTSKCNNAILDSNMTTLCFKKVDHPTTNDNFNRCCPFTVIFGANVTE